ncbi:MAG: DoxX family protein [Propionibacteriaceae bacterium]|nr:DoxX family protein [Propionibacteriaceae bacterium]
MSEQDPNWTGAQDWQPTQEAPAVTPLTPPDQGSTAVIPPAPAEDIFRTEAVSAEEERLAAERSARKEARLQAFQAAQPAAAAGAATATAPAATAPEKQRKPKRTTDKFFPSFGLFLLRIVVAGIAALRGWVILTNIDAAAERVGGTVIGASQPTWIAIGIGVGLELISLMLLLGVLTRVAGIGLAAISGLSLAFYWWGPWNPFYEGLDNRGVFMGEFELLFAAVGVLFVFLGAGGWAIDHGFRSRREKAKLEREEQS